ncbi:hypothetical protein [Actinophytocola sp.]|uniref:hypothetical protein n=1 Tax=Actinophytocola sp. TaxID=1872138 RepID=UPI003899C7D2
MNEQDFRTALRDTMSVQVPPPPMSDAPVLEAAHRDRRRRRAMWSGAGSAAAVVAVAVGVAVLAPAMSGDEDAQVGGLVTRQPNAMSTESANQPSGPGNRPSAKSSPDVPPGQTDRTARSGTQYERGAALADKLAEVIPAGYGSPDLPTPAGDSGGGPFKYHQANYEDTLNGRELWDYEAYAPVTKGEGVGRLLVEVHTAGSVTGDGCGLQPLWGMAGSCTEVAVGGKRVAVVTVANDRFDQWAGYRYDDGTVVFVAQATTFAFADKPALDGLPFTAEQLAALATDPRFKVT